MGFNKRYITERNLKYYADRSIDDLIRYVRKPDALIIEMGVSQKVCDIILKNKSKKVIKEELKNIGFYGSK